MTTTIYALWYLMNVSCGSSYLLHLLSYIRCHYLIRPPTPENSMAITIILHLSHEMLSVYSAFHTSKPYMSSELLTMFIIQRLIMFDG